MTTAGRLETYLENHIPLSKSMGVQVTTATPDTIILSAPLAPNINHRETIFGGSASALCILSAWSLVHLRLLDESRFHPRIVIQRNQMEYTKPILGAFQAECQPPAEPEWHRLLKSLDRKGIGRIHLSSTLRSDREDAGHFSGTFVVTDLNRSHE